MNNGACFVHSWKKNKHPLLILQKIIIEKKTTGIKWLKFKNTLNDLYITYLGGNIQIKTKPNLAFF